MSLCTRASERQGCEQKVHLSTCAELSGRTDRARITFAVIPTEPKGRPAAHAHKAPLDRRRHLAPNHADWRTWRPEVRRGRRRHVLRLSTGEEARRSSQPVSQSVGRPHGELTDARPTLTASECIIECAKLLEATGELMSSSSSSSHGQVSRARQTNNKRRNKTKDAVAAAAADAPRDGQSAAAVLDDSNGADCLIGPTIR